MGVYECNRDVTPRIRQAYVPRTAVTPDFLPLAIAQGGCSQAHVFLQPLNCALRTIGLNEIDGDAEYDDDKDELRFDPLAQKGGNHAGDEKNDDQRIQEQVQPFKCESTAAGGTRWGRTWRGAPRLPAVSAPPKWLRGWKTS